MFSPRLSFLAIAALAIASSCQADIASLATRDEALEPCRHLISLKFNHGCKANKFVAEFAAKNGPNYIYDPYSHLDQGADICIGFDEIEGPFGAIAGDHQSKAMDLESLYINFERINSAFAFKKNDKDGKFLKESPANITRAHWLDRKGTTLSDYIYFDSDVTSAAVSPQLLQKGQFTDLMIEFC